jgi:hypothetical protein
MKSTIQLGTDTYTMAFKACNYDCYKELDINPREQAQAVFAAFFVVFMQWSLIFFVVNYMTSDPTFILLCPKNLSVLATRFIATLMMHMTVSADIKSGLLQMKFVTYHDKEF